MSCTGCYKNTPILHIVLKTSTQELHTCPNCLAIKAYNNELDINNDDSLICDVTNKPGAIQYIGYDETYTLNKESLIRLIKHNLTPDEWNILVNKYGETYMLHDDFYDELGIAIQPMED